MAPRLPILAVALLVTTCACSSGSGSSASGHAKHHDTPSPALLSWTGDLCTANKPLLKMPPLADIPRPSTEADREPLERYLVKVGDVLIKGQGNVTDLRSGPTRSARTMAGTEQTDLEESASAVVSQYTSNAVLFPADKLESVYTLSIVAAAPWDPGDPGLVNYLDDHADLAAAYLKAPACASDRKARHSFLSRLP